MQVRDKRYGVSSIGQSWLTRVYHETFPLSLRLFTVAILALRYTQVKDWSYQVYGDAVTIRGFSSQLNDGSKARDVEDAPDPMRRELLDCIYSISEHNHEELQPEYVYQAACHSLGFDTQSFVPGGYRPASIRNVTKVEWPRVYDLIARLWPDYERQGLGRSYEEGVNRILAGYNTAWELDDDGKIRRVLPEEAASLVKGTFAELERANLSAALGLFVAGRKAYDDRPQRDRDACTNMFDAMEAVAKTKFQMPDATFGDVVSRMFKSSAVNKNVNQVFLALNDLRNKEFGHGMTIPFRLSKAEVDFTYLSCVGAVLHFVRMK